ncbi:hypothetical protein A33M_3019 [Rhodovulum sp. PH10]|nr:hypothetical protein A33M_3019 [Rhodovulum sp. PH10]
MRAEAFGALPAVQCVPLDTGAVIGGKASIYNRVMWKLGRPNDTYKENEALMATVERERPDAILVDSSRVITVATLRAMRNFGPIVRAYYSPDDSIGRHFLSAQLEASLPLWDVFFTNKQVNVPELKALGAANPVHVGKGCDPAIHRPLVQSEVGTEYDSCDLVFVGSFEAERCRSINRLAGAGMRVVVWGDNWPSRVLDPRVTVRPAQYGTDYGKALHTGKIALGFLRKLNRDTITSRSWETTAMGRPLLAEKTDDHDTAFIDGEGYVGFTDDDDLVAKARTLLGNDELRLRLAEKGRERCLSSGASTVQRAMEMLGHIQAARERILGQLVE